LDEPAPSLDEPYTGPLEDDVRSQAIQLQQTAAQAAATTAAIQDQFQSVEPEPATADDEPLRDVEVRHVEAAARIVESGVTRVEALRVARVLAEYTAGTAPSTIARKLRMGYETVACILDFYTEQIEVKA
ncbi:MAG: hypothetical protein ACRDTI_16810, partial [Mycobacterium sp.]